MQKIYGTLSFAGFVAIAASCATASQNPGGNGGNGSNGTNTFGTGTNTQTLGSSLSSGAGQGTNSCVSGRACSSGCTDFSSTPILDGSGSSFNASSSTSGGPCIIEPGDGALLPNNWVRPRFKWTGGSAPFKITIHSGREASDQVVYTSNSQWTMPKMMWQGLASSGWDDGSGSDAITVTVADGSGGSQMKMFIAPANANGSMIYWTAAGDMCGFSWLEGFGVGDETVGVVLTAPTGPYANNATNVQWDWSRDSGGNLSTTNRHTNATLPSPGDDQCIGCHVAVPDKNSVAFDDFYPWVGVTSQVDPGNVGKLPPWLTPGGAETLSQGGLGMMSFSPTVWDGGQHLVVAATQVAQNASNNPWASIGGDNNPSNLIWIDLSTSTPPTFVNGGGMPLPSISVPTGPFYANQGKTYGFINRNNDSNSASCPTWSHDGTKIVYASNNAPKSGRIDVGSSDLYVVPFDASAKQSTGNAAPISGASASNVNEYYPAFSPDDKYIAYNSAQGSPGNMYYNPQAEIFVIPASGGTGTRLAANSPPSCSGKQSPGVYNSWARWSPEYPSCNGKTYYWLIFSSGRLGNNFTGGSTNFRMGIPNEPTSQLYLTSMVDDGSGNLKTFPAVYIWNQSTQTPDGMYAQSNHTPAWETVSIPAPPPPK